MNKKAQAWTIDYILALLLFITGLGISLFIIIDAFEERSYDYLVQEALRIGETLVTPGFPMYYEEHNLIRSGLTSNNRFSWRKAQIISELSDQELRDTLPIITNAAITLTRNGALVALNDSCSIGTTTLPQTTNDNHTYFSIAYYASANNNLESFLITRNATIYAQDELQELFANKHHYDIIIFEDPEFILHVNDTYSQEQLNNDIALLSEYAKKLLFIGNVSQTTLGITLNEPTAITSTVQEHHSSYYSFEQGLNVSLTQARTVQSATVNYQEIAQGIIRWQSKDSINYYFSQTTGLYNNTLPLLQEVEEGIRQSQKKSSITCIQVRPEELSTSNLAYVERIIPDRGTTIKLGVYVWRND